MWKSMPLWAMAAIPAVPGFGIVLLQAYGGSEHLQKIAFGLFIGAVVLVTYLIRLRKRAAPTTPTPPKKLLLGLVLWLVAFLILALVWANGQALLRLVHG
jgi:hypothetical protein